MAAGLTAWAQEPLMREHVELTYDRERGCEPGDTIHFTAHVTREGHEGPTDYSRVLYVELLNPEGVVIQRRKLPLTEGEAQGVLSVDTFYGTGFYELRAFTRYMTNWKDYGYWARLLPVYQPLREGDRPDVRRLRLTTARSVGETSGRLLNAHRDTVFGVEQPVEKQLMVFGHIAMRPKRSANAGPVSLGGHALKLMIHRPGLAFDGVAHTDSLGFFGLYFPDVQGEWNLRITRPKSSDHDSTAVSLSRDCIITTDELFAPTPRRWPTSAFAPENFGFSKWKDDRSGSAFCRFFNCDQANITWKNQGFVSQRLYQFLGRADGRFDRTTGIASPSVLNIAPDSLQSLSVDINLYGSDSADPRTVCVDGPCFEGGPIVWIVDGAYRLVTGLSKPITDFEVFRPTTQPLPIYLDEVRSIYISQSPTVFRPYLRCSVLEKKHPLTVFITTRRNYVWDDSSLLSTFFTGFSE